MWGTNYTACLYQLARALAEREWGWEGGWWAEARGRGQDRVEEEGKGGGQFWRAIIRREGPEKARLVPGDSYCPGSSCARQTGLLGAWGPHVSWWADSVCYSPFVSQAQLGKKGEKCLWNANGLAASFLTQGTEGPDQRQEGSKSPTLPSLIGDPRPGIPSPQPSRWKFP
jgi:hypothetical protein